MVRGGISGKGIKAFESAYGGEGHGLAGNLTGMGPEGEEVTGEPGEAVIFVEVSYDYQPLIGDVFTNTNEITTTAAFNVRDDRDLTQIYQRDGGSPDPAASCSVNDGFGAYATTGIGSVWAQPATYGVQVGFKY